MIRDNSNTPNTLKTEITRLYNKKQLVIETIGLLPGITDGDTKGWRKILELGCGSGAWTLAMAQKRRNIQVIGIDPNEAMIAFAQEMAKEQGVNNYQYLLAPQLVGPFAFPDASFDMIFTQMPSKYLWPSDWPSFLAECWRLLRPGGRIHVVEFETDFSNSPAHEDQLQLFRRAMRLSGRSFSPSDTHVGLICELEPLITSAGFIQTRCIAHPINYSYGTAHHEEWTNDYLIFSRLNEPLLISTGVATQEQIDALYQQQQKEMHSPNFHAMLIFLSVWGIKGEGGSPLSADPSGWLSEVSRKKGQEEKDQDNPDIYLS